LARKLESEGTRKVVVLQCRGGTCLIIGLADTGRCVECKNFREGDFSFGLTGGKPLTGRKKKEKQLNSTSKEETPGEKRED